MKRFLSCGVFFLLIFISTFSCFAVTQTSYAVFINKKYELLNWAIQNGKTTDDDISHYYLIQTTSDGGSWSLIKSPQTTENGHHTPYYSSSSPAGIRVYPVWKVQEYGGSIHFENASSRLGLSGVLSSDVDILNQDGSIYYPADFTTPPESSTSDTTEYPSDFIGPIPPSDYYAPVLNAGEEQESLTVQHEWLSEAVSNVEGWQSDIDEYITGIDEAASNVADYLDSGSTVLSSFLTAAPTAVVAFVTFGLAFLVIRKVIGR